MCENCINKLGNKLINTKIKVWWYDDKRSYYGTINNYDNLSDTHRILYIDNEWEFLRLSIEPIMFASSDTFNSVISNNTLDSNQTPNLKNTRNISNNTKKKRYN